jgi:hypothetical protein
LPLYPHDVGKLGGHVLLDGLEAGDLAVSEGRRGTLGTLQPLSNLLPSMPHREQRVSEGHVFWAGEQLFHGLGVPFHELTQR